jgi:hypothetical protein
MAWVIAGIFAGLLGTAVAMGIFLLCLYFYRGMD